MYLAFNSFDEKQRANVNQLFDILSQDGFPQTNLVLNCYLSKSGGYVPNGGNKMRAINFYLFEESAIPNMIKFLAIPRPDGQQQVVKIKLRPARQHQLAQKIMENIKQVNEKIHTFNAFIYLHPYDLPRYSIRPLNL
jgi:hypothetical protein